MVIAGTYDGVVVGWKMDNFLIIKEKNTNSEGSSYTNDSESRLGNEGHLKILFSRKIHEGSIRGISISSMNFMNNVECGGQLINDKNEEQLIKNDGNHTDKSYTVVPDTFLSIGYDETMAIFSLTKRVQCGELKTPFNLGTPTCSSFAPTKLSSTHALIGFSSGKIVIYKRKSWSIEHILMGHDEKGVNCITVHRSGKMALSGGRDGKIVLWDLMRGRLSFIYKVPSILKEKKSIINHIIWSNDGMGYAYCTNEGHVSVRDVRTEDILLDVTLPTRVNQICFVGSNDKLFVVAACDNGSLPMLEVRSVDNNEEAYRRAIMVIEPLENKTKSGLDRLKFIQSVHGGNGLLVLIGNSGGIVSLIDLAGAMRMIIHSDESIEEVKGDISRKDPYPGKDKIIYNYEIDIAAEFLDTVKIGNGAKITALDSWSYDETIHYEHQKDKAVNRRRKSNNHNNCPNNLRCKSPELNEKKGYLIENVIKKNDITRLKHNDIQRACDLVEKARKKQKNRQ